MGIRTRSVSSLSKASEWLSMHNFDILLIDSRFEAHQPIKLLSTAWKHNPLTFGGIFNFYGEVKEEWDAKLLGAYVFSGEDSLEQISQTIEKLPRQSFTPEDFPVLMVDDLDSPRDIICSFIEALGYNNVDGVKSGNEALHLLLDKPRAYSCIVTDYNMPDMKGTELIRNIRREDPINHLPIIVLTAYATTETLLECIRAGATGFLVKPPRKNALREELEKAKRIYLNRLNPRLCKPEEAHLLEDAILSRARY